MFESVVDLIKMLIEGENLSESIIAIGLIALTIFITKKLITMVSNIVSSDLENALRTPAQILSREVDIIILSSLIISSIVATYSEDNFFIEGNTLNEDFVAVWCMTFVLSILVVGLILKLIVPLIKKFLWKSSTEYIIQFQDTEYKILEVHNDGVIELVERYDQTRIKLIPKDEFSSIDIIKVKSKSKPGNSNKLPSLFKRGDH
ncbi:hypothetical protein ACTWQB_16535 [Piscibacillus sp. B03]|uniref:hypothetical protein n=1 Tax=Piscibacillus sp. B03 TaxID=3457430 RepID=UPI003FCD1109